MRKTWATILILSMTTTPLFAEGSIGRSISTEASRLVHESQTGAAPAAWRAVMRLETETPILVSTASATVRGRFVFADDGLLTIFTPAQSGLPADIERRFRAAIDANPSAVAAAAEGGAKLIDAFRIGPDGVFVEGRKVAERADVLRQLRTQDVVTISRKRRRGDANSAAGSAIVGGLAGCFLGLLMFYDKAGAGAAIGVVAIPIGSATAAGYAAWRGTSSMTEEVIYRSPARP
jgi:hypothetical protein